MTRVGVMLPTFTADGRLAMAAADAAEDGGLDGVFAFDHLWPIGRPGRPALWSFGVLASVAARTRRVAIGTFVARIDLLPDDELVRAFATLAAIAGPGRVIAALGAGDRLSAPENDAYGLAPVPLGERLAMMADVADRLRAEGITTWIAGSSDKVGAIADEHADARTVWAEDLRFVGSSRVPIAWGGPMLIGRDSEEVSALSGRYGHRPGLVAGTVGEVAAHVDGLPVSWCICSPLDYLSTPVRAVETVCLVKKAVQ